MKQNNGLAATVQFCTEMYMTRNSTGLLQGAKALVRQLPMHGYRQAAEELQAKFDAVEERMNELEAQAQKDMEGLDSADAGQVASSYHEAKAEVFLDGTYEAICDIAGQYSLVTGASSGLAESESSGA